MRHHSGLRWAVLCGALLASSLAEAADIKVLGVENEKTMLSLTGKIIPGDHANFLKEMTLAGKNPVKAIQLDSPGGSVLEAVEIAGTVRANNIATSVTKGDTCASSCFIVFTAGAEKYVEPGARVGVHAVSDQDGKEAADGTVATARFLRELGISETIVGKFVLARPNEVAWLTMDDLRSMGVLVSASNRTSLSSGWPICSRPLQLGCARQVDYDPFAVITDPTILSQLNAPNYFDKFDPPGKRRRGGKTYYQSNGHWFEGAP